MTADGPSATRPALAGRLIVVTRPKGQAGGLVGQLHALGAEVLDFPLIVIRPCADASMVAALRARLDTLALAFFVSPTAVQLGLPLLAPWPAHLPMATVGEGSANALRSAGCRNLIVPAAGADSEALLAMPAFQEAIARGGAVLLVGGEGGRGLIASALRDLGIEVVRLDCYRRVLPDVSVAPLLGAARARRLDAICISSSEAVAHLQTLCGGSIPDELAVVTLFASHPRIAERARRAGFRMVIATEPGDEACIRQLVRTFSDSSVTLYR